MKVLVIYQSVHKGNTKKIAEVIAKKLKAKLVKPNEILIDDLRKYDLIGFGSGIYFWKHHKEVLDFADKIVPTHQKAFIFSTAGIPKMKFVWHQALKNILRNKGFKIVGEFICAGHDEVGPLKKFGGINKGRPNLEDLQKAKIFAKNLKIA